MQEAEQDIERLERKRPNLADPEEFAIIRDIHFAKDTESEDLETLERLDRMRRREKHRRITSR